MFATEPILTSLAALLKEKDEYSDNRGGGDNPGGGREDIDIDELEIQKGMLQIGKGLEFLHSVAGLVHGNLSPDAIVLNAQSDWKITGLGFSGKAEGTNVATSAPSIALSEVLNIDPRLPTTVQLDLDYCSPDFVLDHNVTTSADMFSLGLLLISLHNAPHKSPLETHGSVSSYKRVFSSSATIPTIGNNFKCKRPLGNPVANVLSRLITRRPANRLSAKEFQQVDYFDNILVSTIKFLETLPAKTPNEKSQFLRGLPRIMPQFSAKTLERKVLPALLEEMKDKD